MLEKLEYYMCLFLYALKVKGNVSKNTLFRYVYIYDVTNDYLGNSGRITEDMLLDKDLGLVNVVELTNALNEVSRRNYITIKGSNVEIKNELVTYVESIIETEKGSNDLNKIMYFVEIVSSYSEDVVLSAFFSEPNVENALARGKKDIVLSNNRLQKLFEEFENVANNQENKNLDKYDVFSSWLDFVLETYLQEKEVNEQ